MAVLVGVHGMAKHQLGRHQLMPAWSLALADGVERAVGRRVAPPEVDIAFYGDLFLPVSPQAGTKSPDDADVFEQVSEQEWQEIADGLAELVGEEEVAAATGRPDMGYTRVPVPLQAVLRAIDRRFGAASAILVVGVLRQVRRYLRETVDKAAIDARVAESVGGDCRVLIGHSLGSVVAYEYLRTHPDHQVQLLLTVGSPLGLRMVRGRLPMTGMEVPRWVNVRDRRDPVACAGQLRRWWPQIAEADELVVGNGADTHGVERYLSRRQTGEVLVAALPQLADG